MGNLKYNDVLLRLSFATLQIISLLQYFSSLCITQLKPSLNYSFQNCSFVI